MDILDDMGVSKLSANVFFFSKVNYSCKLVYGKTRWSLILAEIVNQFSQVTQAGRLASKPQNKALTHL